MYVCVVYICFVCLLSFCTFCAGIRHREFAQLTVLLSPLVNWFGLGIQLGIYHHELKKIDLEERGSVDRCLAAMLLRWMNEKDDVKAFGGATKGKLVSALKEIEEIALAEAIAQATIGDLKYSITIILPTCLCAEFYSFWKCSCGCTWSFVVMAHALTYYVC